MAGADPQQCRCPRKLLYLFAVTWEVRPASHISWNVVLTSDVVGESAGVGVPGCLWRGAATLGAAV